ncbi:MAG TPA: gamma carbonic anhydrase family protein, partial [Candidatus Limnocylindria bacterium]|nr:gamma carbonic anhydrase family protein [Candidatus Limnocylindria bacterium]
MSGHAPDWPQRLRLDPTAFVAPGAVVVGDVTMGARASVWFQSVLRGDSAPITIGEHSNVQDLSVVHCDEGLPAVIGRRVTIGHRTIVHGCVIEDDCLIGMGAILLSGARIGAGTLIGAGALVREAQVIPPGSLAVGAPARVVGPVTDSHREAIRNGAAHYADLARDYLARGFARPHPRSEAETGSVPHRGPMTFGEWGGLMAT